MPFVSTDFDLDFSVDGSNGDDLDAIDAGWSYVGAVSTQVLEKAGGAYLVSSAGGGGVAAYGHAMGDPDDALEAVFRLSTATSGESGLLCGVRFNTSTFVGYTVTWVVGAAQFNLRREGGGGTVIGSWAPPTPSPGDTFLVRIQATGTTIEVWIDGVLRISETDATYSSGSFFVATIDIANASQGQVLQTLTGGTWADAYDIEADPGAVIVSGTDANLEHHRVLSAEAGSYAVTGTAADLRRAYTLSAEAEAVAVAGTAAGLVRALMLAADDGSVTVSGGAANLTLHRVMPAEAGAVTVIGADAALGRGIVLGAESGAVAVTGMAADLRSDHRIVADAGAFSVSGQDATLGRGFQLSAEAGNVAATGSAAGLIRDYLVAAESGAVVVSGTAANLGRHLTLPVDAGAVNITGTAADLLRTTTLAAGSGAISIVGVAASLTNNTPALRIDDLVVLIREGGHGETNHPRAPEVRRGARGNALSSITAVRGHRRRWSFTTPPLSASDAAALEAVISTGLPLPCTGVAVDGGVTAYCPPETINADADEALRYTVSFELMESL